MDVLYEDERIIVVDKPHFLATMPRGMWYRQTALIRLRERLGEPDITPAHRLDRMTAGVLVFVRDPACRGAYQMLFQNRQASRSMNAWRPAGRSAARDSARSCRSSRHARSHCCADRTSPRNTARWPHSRNRVWPTPKPSSSAATSVSLPLTGGARSAGGGPHPGNHPICRYTLHPRTGKTHQLRVHMNSLGLPIVGDDFYPRIQTRPYDDFSQPLQLVARMLRFTDPITGEKREFVSRVPLKI